MAEVRAVRLPRVERAVVVWRASMQWVYKIAGITAGVVVAALAFLWCLLSSVAEPEGHRMFNDVNGLGALGHLPYLRRNLSGVEQTGARRIGCSA
jgi:hypothetical protein